LGVRLDVETSVEHCVRTRQDGGDQFDSRHRPIFVIVPLSVYRGREHVPVVPGS
jgi:hypothetical protein